MSASPSMSLSCPARFRVPPHDGLSRCHRALRHTLSVAGGILFSLLSLVPSPLMGQTGLLRVSIPSPTAASLGKFGAVPVGLYAGTPSLSIPLFTAQGRTLDLPITLNYSAGGIRVQEIGSWVGIGWALDAGGVITRTVRGKVDELAGGFSLEGHRWFDPLNWPSPTLETASDVHSGILDGEPDLFFFSFGGRSGQFVMGPTVTPSVLEYRTIPYQNLRIEPVFTVPGVPDSWVITTEDGTRYTFAARETTTDQSQNSTLQINTNPVSYTSSWYLTEIKAPGGDSITLTYLPYSATHETSTYQEKFANVTGAQGCVEDLDVYNMDAISGVRLSSITTAKHVVTFIPGATLRSDALSPTGQPQEVRLDLITVATPANTVVRQFQLAHDYSTGRLTLRSVTELTAAGVALPPHTFTYGGPVLPSTTSFAQDHWGFYNGKIGNTMAVPAVAVQLPSPTGGFFSLALTGADRSPSGPDMMAGVLTRVTYPTGGSNEFLYEPHDYGAVGELGGLPDGEGPLQTASVTSWEAGTLVFQVGGTQDVIATVHVQQSPGGCGGVVDPPCPFTKLDGTQWFDADATHFVLLSPGSHTLIANDQGTWPAGSAQISVTWREINPSPQVMAGGARLAELRTDDGMGHVDTTRYQYTLSSDPARSSGHVFRAPKYHYSVTTSNCSYFARASSSKVPLGSGNFVGYTEVTVLHGASGQGGRSVHHFGYESDQQSAEWPGATPTSMEWARGRELAVEEYNAAGQLQQRTTTTWVTPAEPVTDRVWPGMSLNFFGSGGFFNQPVVEVIGAFQVLARWPRLVGDRTVSYGATGTDSLVTSRSFVQGNPAHAQITEQIETLSDGTERITRFRYAPDYAPGSGTPEADALAAMAGPAHMHSQVIEKLVIHRVQNTDTVVRAELTTFKGYQPGQYLPFKRYLLDSSTPVVVP